MKQTPLVPTSADLGAPVPPNEGNEVRRDGRQLASSCRLLSNLPDVDTGHQLQAAAAHSSAAEPIGMLKLSRDRTPIRLPLHGAPRPGHLSDGALIASAGGDGDATVMIWTVKRGHLFSRS